MDSGSNNNHPAGDGQEDNILNEQPIEISSDSSNGSKEELEEDDDVESGSEPDLDSDSDVSIINSVSDSSESQNDERLEDEFETILAMPYKDHKLYMQLCHTAFKLNVFEKIDLAINEFEKCGAIPSHIWLKYLKALKVVTQTPLEHQKFQSKCRLALSSYYDEQLAEFIVNNYLEKQPIDDLIEMWGKLLADYGIDRVDFLAKMRAKFDKDRAEELGKMLNTQCVTLNCDDEQLQAIQELMEEFKQKLKSNTNSPPGCRTTFINRLDTLTLDGKIKVTMGKEIYERCLAKYPSEPDLWLDYVFYMQKNQNYTLVSDGHLKCTPFEILKRGLLTKPNVQLNHKFLQVMEQQQFSVAQIDEELSPHFKRIERYTELTVELYLDYLAYRVRNTHVEDEQQVSGLRDTFRRVWERLSEQYGEMADTGYEVLQLWALVEYAKLKSPSSGAAIWNEIFGYTGNHAKSHLWVAYIQMESEYNGGRNVKAFLHEALSYFSGPAEDFAAITDLYRRYERCFGTSDSIAECQEIVEQIQISFQHRSFMSGGRGRSQRPTTYAQGRRGQQQQQQTQIQNRSGRKQHLTKPMKQTPPIAKKMMTSQSQKQNPNPKPKTAADGEEPKEPNFKYSPHLEANKIFIKNLYAQCTKEDLTAAFQPFGTIKDVRLVYRHNKIFKGIAYIEYEQPEEARKAVIAGDGLDIGGQNIVVAISNPPPKGAPIASTSAGSFGSASGGGAKKQAEKRRMPTSLIPTKLVMMESKRRKKLELDEDAATMGTSSDANGSKSSGLANGDSESASTSASTAPKSNADFRKLFTM